MQSLLVCYFMTGDTVQLLLTIDIYDKSCTTVVWEKI